jgi:hypothetical protein
MRGLACEPQHDVASSKECDGGDEEGRHCDGTNTKDPLNVERLHRRLVAGVYAGAMAALYAVGHGATDLLRDLAYLAKAISLTAEIATAWFSRKIEIRLFVVNAACG